MSNQSILFFYDPVINQHSISEGSRRCHIFDSGDFLTLSTPTFFRVKIDRSSLLTWQKIEGVDTVGTRPFLVKYLGYDLCEQRIHLKTAEYINMGTGWCCFREHDQNEKNLTKVMASVNMMKFNCKVWNKEEIKQVKYKE